MGAILPLQGMAEERSAAAARTYRRPCAAGSHQRSLAGGRVAAVDSCACRIGAGDSLSLALGTIDGRARWGFARRATCIGSTFSTAIHSHSAGPSADVSGHAFRLVARHGGSADRTGAAPDAWRPRSFVASRRTRPSVRHVAYDVRLSLQGHCRHRAIDLPHRMADATG